MRPSLYIQDTYNFRKHFLFSKEVPGVCFFYKVVLLIDDFLIISGWIICNTKLVLQKSFGFIGPSRFLLPQSTYSFMSRLQLLPIGSLSSSLHAQINRFIQRNKQIIYKHHIFLTKSSNSFCPKSFCPGSFFAIQFNCLWLPRINLRLVSLSQNFRLSSMFTLTANSIQGQW